MIEVGSVERWAESLLGAVSELCDQMDSQKATLSASTSSVYALHTQSSASKDAMQLRITDLQALLLDAEKKEKALLAKITQLGKLVTSSINECCYCSYLVCLLCCRNETERWTSRNGIEEKDS